MKRSNCFGSTSIVSSAREDRRRAFTMIEILVTIVIIALLAALLLPAIGMAVRTAKVGQVTGEINSMAQALADFRTKMGAYPPSRILLSERGTYTIDATTQAYATGIADITDGQLAQRSVTWLRRIWPRAAFTVGTTGSPPAAPTIPGPLGFHDFNGNNAVDPPYVLTGDECLVFFLGGIPSKITTPGGGSITFGLNGFNREPSNPFIANTVILGSNTYSFSSRVPALYEFKADRLVDLDNDGMPSYADTLGTRKVFAYFSAYGGGAYDGSDVDFPGEADDAGNGPLSLKFTSSYPIAGGGRVAQSVSPNPYTVSATTGTNITYHAPNSFMIISAGIDGLYGPGGAYIPGADTPLPPDLANTYAGSTLETDVNIRKSESDNITSFSGGKLD
jgi:prepilin-type N-terminal cleavage/methylation domain-containing protein